MYIIDHFDKSIEEKYSDQIIGGLDDGSQYVVLARPSEELHWAFRPVLLKQGDEITIGGKLRLAYNDFFESEEQREKVQALEPGEMKQRALHLIEATKKQILFESVNPVRAKAFIISQQEGTINTNKTAQKMINGFEEMSGETVEDKMSMYLLLGEIFTDMTAALAKTLEANK